MVKLVYKMICHTIYVTFIFFIPRTFQNSEILKKIEKQFFWYFLHQRGPILSKNSKSHLKMPSDGNRTDLSICENITILAFFGNFRVAHNGPISGPISRFFGIFYIREAQQCQKPQRAPARYKIMKPAMNDWVLTGRKSSLE